MSDSKPTHQVHVLTNDTCDILVVLHGANLRQALLDHGLSPYAVLTQRANCGGRGLCATCGVWFEAGEPAPSHWHHQLAARFAYPRLSCQINVNADMIIRLLADKRIWGKHYPTHRWKKE